MSWRVVHHDARRDVYTLERTRRFFRGRYRVATGEECVRERIVECPCRIEYRGAYGFWVTASTCPLHGYRADPRGAARRFFLQARWTPYRPPGAYL